MTQRTDIFTRFEMLDKGHDPSEHTYFVVENGTVHITDSDSPDNKDSVYIAFDGVSLDADPFDVEDFQKILRRDIDERVIEIASGHPERAPGLVLRSVLNEYSEQIGLSPYDLEYALRCIHSLEAMVSIDQLTGAFDRKSYDRDIQAQVSGYNRLERSSSERGGAVNEGGVLPPSPFSIAIIDVDFFKRVNEEIGHWGGDVVLKQLVAIIKEELRESDRVYRYGGEEFVVILDAADGEQATKVMNRVRESIQRSIYQALTDAEFTFSSLKEVTVSIGISTYGTQTEAGIVPAQDEHQLFAQADMALYAAKSGVRTSGQQSGRNRVELYGVNLEQASESESRAPKTVESIQLHQAYSIAKEVIDNAFHTLDGDEADEQLEANTILSTFREDTAPLHKSFGVYPVDPKVGLEYIFSRDAVVTALKQHPEHVKRIQAAIGAIEGIATKHPLTELPNREGFQTVVDRRLSLAERSGRPFTLIRCDIDNLKITNDRLGHIAGDVLIKSVAQSLQSVCRTGESLGHISGDEFSLLIEETDPDRVMLALARFRQAVRENALRIAEELLDEIGMTELKMPFTELRQSIHPDNKKELTMSFGATIVEPQRVEQDTATETLTAQYQVPQYKIIDLRADVAAGAAKGNTVTSMIGRKLDEGRSRDNAVLFITEDFQALVHEIDDEEEDL